MIKALIVACVLATAASAPTTLEEPKYTIMYEGPEGRHMQMGEPGKAVYGRYMSRSADGLMEYSTEYEADEKGFRARGDHLPISAQLAHFRSADSDSGLTYVFNYNTKEQSHYQMGEPGKAVEGSYMYYDTEGRARRVDYIADENGFRVKPVAQPAAVEEAVSIKAVDPPAPAVASTKPVVEVIGTEAVAAPADEPLKVSSVETAPAVAAESPAVSSEAELPKPTADDVPAIETDSAAKEPAVESPAEPAKAIATAAVSLPAQQIAPTPLIKPVIAVLTAPTFSLKPDSPTKETVTPVKELEAEPKTGHSRFIAANPLSVLAYYRSSMPYYAPLHHPYSSQFRFSPYPYSYPIFNNYAYSY